MMRQSLRNCIGLILALVFTMQALLPMSALASVEMRCVGQAASSTPCQRGLLPISVEASETRVATMACCRHMRGVCPMRSAASVSPLANAALSAPSCLLSLHPLSSERAALAPGPDPSLLHAALALAPPAIRPQSAVKNLSTTSLPASVPLPLSCLMSSQRLRAPPAA